MTILCDSEVANKPVTDGVEIEDETFADTSDDDETERKILVEFGVTPTDAVVLTILCDSEVANELVTDGVEIEDETFADTSDDDETERKILVEFGVTPTDAVVLTILCDSEVANELVTDGVEIEDETFADTSDDDETERKILVEFGVTPTDAVVLTILCDSEVANELVTDGVEIEDETFADTSDDDETERKILVEFGVTPTDAVVLTILCDSEVANELVTDGVEIEDEIFADTTDDDETKGKILVEFGVTPKDAVALIILCDSVVVKEPVTDGVNIEDEKFADASDDDETEGKILVKCGVTPSDTVALVVPCDSEMATEVVADCVDIEDETFADTLDDDDDETKGKILVEFGVTPKDAVALTILCDSEEVKELVIDGVDIVEDETFPDTSDDDGTEGKILVKFGITPKDAVALTILCDSEVANELVVDGVDIEDETFADASDDDETKGKTPVEFGVMPKDAVALIILCDSEVIKEPVTDGVNIEDETVADSCDDDETEGEILVEFGVTPSDTVPCDSEMATEVVADCVDIEDETFADSSDDDETEGMILVKFGVTPRDTVALAVLCDSDMATEVAADCNDIGDEICADTSDNDEREGKILVEFGVTPKDAVALTIICDSKVANELVCNGFDIEDETFADTSDDDETKGKILVEFGVTPRDTVALAVLCDNEMVTDVSADCSDMEDETISDTRDDDEKEGKILVEFGVTPKDAVVLTILCDSEEAKELATDGVNIEEEIFADTTDDDETKGKTLVKCGVTPRDTEGSAVLCDSEMATEVVANCADIEDETF